MEEKYMTKLLNFSSDIICNAEELVITKEQAKGIIKELEQDYVPKAIIKLEIKKLKDKLNIIYNLYGASDYEFIKLEAKIQILQELLGE